MASKTHSEMMIELLSQPKAERDAKVAELKKLCTCATCLTFKGTGETKLLFCALGKGNAIVNEKECLCPACPVTTAVNLKWNFYCTRGSGLQQGRKK